MATKPTKKRIRMYGLNAGKNPLKRQRPASDSRYHTYRWEMASKAYRKAHPLCAECLKKGIYVPAQVVDHVIPVAICKDFWDEKNWQSLCQSCNIAKGNRDKKYIQGKEKYPR